jgi:adenylate cyclase
MSPSDPALPNAASEDASSVAHDVARDLARGYAAEAGHSVFASEAGTSVFASEAAQAWASQHRQRRVMVVVDVVESVRLMLSFETDVIDRWRRFVHDVTTQVLPAQGARMVKSLGDGLLLDFDDVAQAVAAGVEMQRRLPAFNVGRPAQAALHLRVGVHVADVVVDTLDVFGAGVNLAARLAALAGPGQVVVSAAVQGAVVAQRSIVTQDLTFHDMGDCFVKHIDEPVHAYRVLDNGMPSWAEPSAHALGPQAQATLPMARALVPRVAVMPLVDQSDDARLLRVGASLGDDLTNHMARCAHWQITSRGSAVAASANVLRAGFTSATGALPTDGSPSATPLRELGTLLKVDFVVTGTVLMHGDQVEVALALTEVRSGAVLWADTLHSSVAQLMQGDQAVSRRATTLLMRALLRREVALAHVAAVPNLPSYALLLQAIAQMHSLAPGQPERAYDTLTHLAERHPRAPDVLAWQAQWHMLQYFQHRSSDPARDVQAVQRLLTQALAMDPNHAMALTMKGHVSAAIDRDNVAAEQTLRLALQSNANESLAWVFMAYVFVCQTRMLEGVSALEQARSISPLDPMAYFFDVFAASVYGAAGYVAEALTCAERAVKANPHHLSGLIVLLVAQHDAGRFDEARNSAVRYLQMRPTASVQRYLDAHPDRGGVVSLRESRAMLDAGIPL